jgi:hypothetical protein
LQDGKPKYFFLTWVGPSVSVLAKGRVSMQKSGVYNLLGYSVAEVYAVDREAIDEAAILASLSKSFKGSTVTLSK